MALGDGNEALCEFVHIRADFFAAVWRARLEQERKMAQQLDTWQREDWQNGGDRRWLSLLVDAMEEAARPEIRSRPCEAAILAALRAQLARPAIGYLRAASALRH
jgi:hypothetical protein